MNIPLPLTLRAPFTVAVLLIITSIFASERVLTRLEQTQARHLQQMSRLYLESLSVSLVDAMMREDTWQVFDTLDRSQRNASGLRPIETVVTNADGLVIAATNSLGVPPQSTLPEDYGDQYGTADALRLAPRSDVAFAKHEVNYESRKIGSIYTKIDIATQIAERSEVLKTLVITNTCLTLLFAALAFIVVRRTMRPMHILARHLEASGSGAVSTISEKLVDRAVPEYQRAFRAYNRLAQATHEREILAKRLAEEEKLASLGRLASGMAHEINNPLGGLFNAIDTIKRHGDQSDARARALDIIDRGLRGIRDVVRSTLMLYRADKDTRNLRPEDIDDMFLLVSPEMQRRHVILEKSSSLVTELPLPASSIRQILLNLLLNAAQASTRGGTVRADVRVLGQELLVSVEDCGTGLDGKARDVLLGVATAGAPISDGAGLGLWMTNRLITECRGTTAIESAPVQGTRISIRFPLSEQAEIKNVA